MDGDTSDRRRSAELGSTTPLMRPLDRVLAGLAFTPRHPRAPGARVGELVIAVGAAVALSDLFMDTGDIDIP